jgi:hypothetical protein
MTQKGKLKWFTSLHCTVEYMKLVTFIQVISQLETDSNSFDWASCLHLKPLTYIYNNILDDAGKYSLKANFHD